VPQLPMTAVEKKRDELLARLDAEQAELKLYSDYYDGDHRLAFAANKFKEAFGELFDAFATNWCGLVVDVAAERLKVLGFRFGEDDADDQANGIWQANALDQRSLIAHTEAIKLKRSYLLVGPPREPGGEPVITVESPTQCIVEHDPADVRRRLFGLKRYRAADGATIVVLWTPDWIYTWRKDGIATNMVEVLGVWIPEGAGGDWTLDAVEENPTGVVLLIPLENNGQLLKAGTSDLKPAISLNDAANKFFTDMLHSSEYIAFPVRVATGVELPRNPVTGQLEDTAEIAAMVSRLWVFEGEKAQVTQLPAGDLSMFVEGVDLAVQHLAAQTRTPPHYLLAKLANVSGDALVAAETGLEHRCRRKHLDFSDPHEEAMRLAFLWRSIVRRGWAGASEDAWRATLDDAETIWSEPANRDPITLTQSLTMKQAIGVPEEQLWEDAGYTPQQIKRMRVMRDAQIKREAEAQAARQGGGGPQGGPTHTVGVTDQGDQLAVTGIPGPPAQPAEPKAA
jgi:hypothetical protein